MSNRDKHSHDLSLYRQAKAAFIAAAGLLLCVSGFAGDSCPYSKGICQTHRIGQPSVSNKRLFEERKIYVDFDYTLEVEMGISVRSVSLLIRKVHLDGEVTIKELVLNEKLGTKGDSVKYAPNASDSIGGEWLKFDYKIQYDLWNGAIYMKEGWRTSTSPYVVISLPYYSRPILIVTESDSLSKLKVKEVEVTLSFPFIMGNESKSTVIKVADHIPDLSMIVYTFKDSFEVDCAIKWRFEDGSMRVQQGRYKDPLAFFLDQIPKK